MNDRIEKKTGLELILGALQSRTVLKITNSRLFAQDGLIQHLLLVMLYIATAVVFLSYLCWAFARPVWYDEVAMLDPAWQMVTKGEFSTACLVTSGVYAWNYPLHIGILAVLIKVFGLNFYVMRSYPFISTLLGLFLLIRLMLRKRWISSSSDTLVFLSLAALTSLLKFVANQVRPECVTFLLVVLWFGVLFSDKAHTRRNQLTLFGLSTLIPWCGVHMAIPASLVVALMWFFNGLCLRRFTLVIAGMFLGVILLFGFYSATGTLSSFLFEGSRVVGNSSIFQRMLEQSFLAKDHLVFLICTALKVPLNCMIVGVVVLLVPRNTRGVMQFVKTPEFTTLAFIFLIPFVMEISANWLSLYLWMCHCPFVVITAKTWSKNSHCSRWVSLISLLILIFSVSSVSYKTYKNIVGEEKSHYKLRFLSTELRADVPAVTDNSAYYWARNNAKDWYGVPYLLANVESGFIPPSLKRPETPIGIPVKYEAIKVAYPGTSVRTSDGSYVIIMETLSKRVQKRIPKESISVFNGWVVTQLSTNQFDLLAR